ncbi:MAG: YezD family protein [Lachnospiraceae bacterium]|nr:YezD family protein [Lachnospiraceae bacterium]
MAEIKKDVSENYLEEVKKAVKEIKYGSLTLIIQDGKVIQIDKTEKVRL